MQISAVDTASTPNTVTVASLANAYVAGARIGEDVMPMVISRGDNSFTSMHTPSRYNGWNTTVIDISAAGSSGGVYSSAANDCRYNLIGIFPYWVSCGSSGNYEVRGQLIEVYECASSWGVSEDVIDAGGGITYKFFNIGSRGFAIRE